MQPRTILVVDDDPAIRDILVTLFRNEGFEVGEAADGDEMRRFIEGNPNLLITLDVNLEGEDGFALAREVRASRDVPIVMISGKADEVDRIVGLELGADDYVTKPFNLREVLARVRAVLRRYAPRPPAAERSRLRFEGWVLDISARHVENDVGEALELTTAEFNLLVLFVERPRRVLTRETILDNLRGLEWSPLDRSVDTLVSRLRKKIEPTPDHPQLIKTVRGVGYVFTLEVKLV
ncbi:MAG: response regulator transcription factor [Siculibacillus sp.]|nr:response regulator transcription factor [Siculibacillus sp.]